MSEQSGCCACGRITNRHIERDGVLAGQQDANGLNMSFFELKKVIF